MRVRRCRPLAVPGAGCDTVAVGIDDYREREARVWANCGATPIERGVSLPTGGTVRIQELGAGVPVVFLHGGSIAGTSWCTLAARLTGARCILVDRPGCGLSAPIVGGPLRDLAAVQAYADRFLPDLLDALELDSAVVASTSYGGFFAFRGAAAAPHRVTKLIEYSWLVGAPSESVPLTVRVAALPGLRALMVRVPMSRSMLERSLRQFGLGRAIDSGAFSDDMLDWAYALLRHTDTLANDVRSSPRLFVPIRGQNRAVLLTDELLATLTMPVLFLWGELDPNGGRSVAEAFAARLPNAELIIVPDAEHAPWLDDLDMCVEHTERFLAA